MSLNQTPSFEGKRALILHRPHPLVDAITRQLQQIGLRAEAAWPNVPQSFAPGDFDLLLFDADMGHDEQFPWPPGTTPMPSIALIGSEAPGRVAWAIRAGADAHLFKPVTSGGVYAALLLASNAFARRIALDAELTELRRRIAQREGLAEATALIMLADNLSAEDAFRKLRLLAMSERRSLEAMAAKLLTRPQSLKGNK